MSDYWAKEKWGDAQPYHAQETLDQKIHKKEQTRWRNLKTLFRMFFVTNIILGLDHGILPAATAELKEELLIGDVFLGFLGSLVFAGTMIGVNSRRSSANYVPMQVSHTDILWDVYN
jgi:hypothetical protein